MATYLVSCTHMPSGEKAFDSFDSCFASNLALAAVGGAAVGALSNKLLKQWTGGSASSAVGVAAGIAAGAAIAMAAWRKCAVVYNKSEPVGKPATAQASPPATAERRRAGMNLERLEVKLNGTENEPPVPEFDFTYYAENPAAKDIKAKFRHKVEIVRFMTTDDNKLVLADAQGKPLLDSSGRPIPLEAANRMGRDRLNWVTIAEEGKDDYVEDVIIQQGQRMSYRHKLQIPPRAELPLPLPVPMRYALTIDADGMKSTRNVDFAVLGTGERPRKYSASAASTSSASDAGGVDSTVATRALKSSSTEAAKLIATHITARGVSLYSDSGTKRKVVGNLKKGAPVRVDDRTEIKVNNNTVLWFKVTAEPAITGWLPARDLTPVK
ncbi:MAG: hypothetical protein IPP88_10915 [Betaproteobacteria bacterium]|nr:hypothetical protein [Betaproteobacteria bacterium]